MNAVIASRFSGLLWHEEPYHAGTKYRTYGYTGSPYYGHIICVTGSAARAVVVNAEDGAFELTHVALDVARAKEWMGVVLVALAGGRGQGPL